MTAFQQEFQAVLITPAKTNAYFAKMPFTHFLRESVIQTAVLKLTNTSNVPVAILSLDLSYNKADVLFLTVTMPAKMAAMFVNKAEFW